MSNITLLSLERLTFTGEDEIFPAFSEQFEATMYEIKMRGCMDDKLTVSGGKTSKLRRPKQPPKVKPKRERGNRSLEFAVSRCTFSTKFYSNSSDSSNRYDCRVERIRKETTTALADLSCRSLSCFPISVMMNHGESNSDCLTGRRILKHDLEEAEQKTSDTIYLSTVLKDLSAAYGSIVSVLDYEVQQQFKKMKLDFINLANTRCSAGSDMATTAFYLNRRTT